MYCRNKAGLKFPGEKTFVFKFCLRRGLFPATIPAIPSSAVDFSVPVYLSSPA